jgi:sulfite exporter TauE/SafE
MELWHALVIGLAGSLHCIGMCGPIAIALPVGAGSRLQFVTGRLLYNFGRVITYAALGVICGFIGQDHLHGRVSTLGFRLASAS